MTDELVELEIGKPAHGGTCVARLDGQVVFVSHTAPGERVRARITQSRKRYLRAEAQEILVASPDRVPLAWPEAGPGGVGGAELAHLALPAQRAWKAQVVREQLSHGAGVAWDGEVEELPGDAERGGWGYRTRVSLIADAAGRPGMYRLRTHEVQALTELPLATPAITALGLLRRSFPPGAHIEIAAPASGRAAGVVVDGTPISVPDTSGHGTGRRGKVRESVTTPWGDLEYTVAVQGFWQVHREAPAHLVAAVLEALGPCDGLRVADLYAGAGLFALPLSYATGTHGQVVAVEADPAGAAAARRNLHSHPSVEVIEAPVAAALAGLGRLDAVVLDPPRAGAGLKVVRQMAASDPASIVYVACDPAALARDLSALRQVGYEVSTLRAFDLFPHTHHVECVVGLTRRR